MWTLVSFIPLILPFDLVITAQVFISAFDSCFIASEIECL